jgi:hypothetical protein
MLVRLPGTCTQGLLSLPEYLKIFPEALTPHAFSAGAAEICVSKPAIWTQCWPW